MRSLLQRLFGRSANAPCSGIDYWERRAEGWGARGVIHVGHKSDELQTVTDAQQAVLFPLLQSRLRGDEQTALDFGCGPGRFTAGLAHLIGGRAIGVDPIARFLELAPAGKNVEYRLSTSDSIPLADGEADIAWICLVLGTIVDDVELARTCAEIERVLRPDGLVFLVDNTTVQKDVPHYRFRSAAAYSNAFPTTTLQHIGEYADLGERIEVLAGRTAMLQR